MQTRHAETVASGVQLQRRALLVEDDEAIGRLVQAVARGAGVELLHVTRLAQARQALQTGTFAVILADLMLPDGSGVDWLEEQAALGLLSDTRVVAFSAGVSMAARARLGAVGVQGFLAKPVSVDTLVDWLTPTAEQSSCVLPSGPDLHAGQTATLPAASPCTVQGAAAAVDQLFGGDQALYDSFRSACQARADADLQRGHEHLAEGDLTALQRLAHSLKSALRLLGEPDLAARAQALEGHCDAASRQPGPHVVAAVSAAWGLLADGWARWAGDPQAPGRTSPAEAAAGALDHPTGEPAAQMRLATFREQAHTEPASVAGACQAAGHPLATPQDPRRYG